MASGLRDLAIPPRKKVTKNNERYNRVAEIDTASIARTLRYVPLSP